MKRYWKIISIATIAVLGIGTFYIQSSFAKTTYPNFLIETISGDKDMLKNITVIGHYVEKGKEEAMGEISEDETSYSSNYFSYIDILRGVFVSDNIKELQKKYRNFMRGKEMEFNFVENDEDLIYVDLNTNWSSNLQVNSATFEVDVLNKAANQSSTFQAPIPLEGKLEHIFISHVDIIGDTLQIITDSTADAAGGYENQLHLYRLDTTSGKLLSGEKIEFSNTILDNGNSSIYPIVDRSEGGQSKYIVFISNIYEEIIYEEIEITEEGYDHERISQEVVIYHTETDKQEKLEFPEEIALDFNVDSIVEDIIYLTNETEDELQVIGYNIASKEIEVEYTIDLNQESTGERFNAYLQDDYISIVSPTKSKLVEAVIKVGDIKTGEIVYEGSVEIDPDHQEEDYRLDISHLNIE